MTVGKTVPLKTKLSQTLSSYGVSVNQLERWRTVQIKHKKCVYIIKEIHYLSLDARSEAGQCTGESGDVMLVSL